MAFSRILSLQITEDKKLKSAGVKVHRSIQTIDGKNVLVAYFYVPGHEISIDADGEILLDKMPLEDIVLSTIKPKNATDEGVKNG